MSQKYKFKSLQIAEGIGKKEQKDPDTLTVFEIEDTRTVDFIKKDSTRQNFPYTHYLTAWYGKDENAKSNERIIKIFFATHLVTIKGHCLEELYNHLCNQKLKSVNANDIRYLEMYPENMPFVSTILIEWKGKEIL